MLIEESKWIKDTMQTFGAGDFPLLNVGSSTEEFRRKTQSYIFDNIFKPLADLGHSVYHTDIKIDDGVDFAGDLNDPAFRQRLKDTGVRSILCSNLLEHLEHPKTIAKSMLDLLGPGGLILVTVPYSYPYHKDPIDTLFRPGVGELHSLFPGTNIIKADIVGSDESFRSDLLRNPKYMMTMVIRWLVPFYKMSDWKHMIKDAFFMNKKYSATCVLLKKTQ